VTSVLAQRLGPVVRAPGVRTLALALVVGIPLGIYSALHAGCGRPGHPSRCGAAVPDFGLGLIFMFFF
jgi:ABC-type dipeptide/oligopeptide/nickel transport system permease component